MGSFRSQVIVRQGFCTADVKKTLENSTTSFVVFGNVGCGAENV